MKVVFTIVAISICAVGFTQNKKKAGRTAHRQTTQVSTNTPVSSRADSNSFNIQHTVTDKYLNGSSHPNGTTAAHSSNETNASPFVSGISAGNSADKTFDTTKRANTRPANNTAGNTTVTRGNDTTYNANTIANGGIGTNSGAVDRSGQAQFGQTNWGDGRGTVGESQWTVPPPITASFSKEFPQTNSATWTRNNVDTTIYSARYKAGAQWITTNYNMAGQRLDTRTEFPLLQPPRPVSVYIAKQPANFEAATIYKIQVQGKPDMYEIRTRNARTVYVNDEGMEVNY